MFRFSNKYFFKKLFLFFYLIGFFSVNSKPKNYHDFLKNLFFININFFRKNPEFRIKQVNIKKEKNLQKIIDFIEEKRESVIDKKEFYDVYLNEIVSFEEEKKNNFLRTIFLLEKNITFFFVKEKHNNENIALIGTNKNYINGFYNEYKNLVFFLLDEKYKNNYEHIIKNLNLYISNKNKISFLNLVFSSKNLIVTNLEMEKYQIVDIYQNYGLYGFFFKNIYKNFSINNDLINYELLYNLIFDEKEENYKNKNCLEKINFRKEKIKNKDFYKIYKIFFMSNLESRKSSILYKKLPKEIIIKILKFLV